MDFEKLIQEAVTKAVQEATTAALLDGKPPADPLARKAVTPKEAAAILGVPLPRMYEYIRRQDFPKIKNGNRYLIPLERFNEWINNGGGDGSGG